MFLIVKKNDNVVSTLKIDRDLTTIGTNSWNDLVLRDRDEVRTIQRSQGR